LNTPTHVLTAVALLTKPQDRRRNWAVLVGGILPDLSIFALVGWARMVENIPHRQIWREIYWQEPWQTLGAISNSFVIWGLLAVIAWYLGARVLLFLAVAAIVHLCLDFPFHAADAHKHFWPLTDWRFHSPLSYWDKHHHSRWVGLFELSLVLISITVLWRRFEHRFVRASLLAGLVSLAIVPAFFRWTLG
jgi:hypothetical protein